MNKKSIRMILGVSLNVIVIAVGVFIIFTAGSKALVKDKTCFYYQIILSDYKDKFVGGTYTLNTAMTPTEMMKVLSCADTGEDK